MTSARLRIWSDRACFTRPDLKVERVSYEVITPSAARGVLEAIYWKPQMRWVIERVHVLKPIRFESIYRHEVRNRTSAQAVIRSARRRSVEGLDLVIEAERQQRSSVVLRDVAYVLDARIELSAEAPAGATVTEHLSRFRRRVRRGQCFHRPYMGVREFALDFELQDGDPPPAEALAGERDLGWMLLDIDFSDDMRPQFFRAVLRDGVLTPPAAA